MVLVIATRSVNVGRMIVIVIVIVTVTIFEVLIHHTPKLSPDRHHV